MLAASIARKEQIKFEEARALLNGEVVGLKAALHEKKKVKLGKIGTLSEDADCKIEFYPYFTGFSFANSSGCPIAYTRSGMYNEISEITSRRLEHNMTFAEANLRHDDISSEGLPDDCYLGVLSKKNYYIPVNKIFARSVACLMIIAILVMPFILPRQYQYREEVKASLNPVESLSAPHRGTYDMNSSVTAIPASESPVEASEGTSEDKESTSDFMIDSPEGHYLIVATFRTEKEAEKYYTKRDSEDFPLQIIHDSKTWKISAAHGDKSSLRHILNSDAFKRLYSKGWIWEAPLR